MQKNKFMPKKNFLKKYQNIIIAFIFVGITVASLVLVFKSASLKNNRENLNGSDHRINISEKNNSAKGSISAVNEPFYNFGNISMRNGNVSYFYKIKNSSDSPALISRMYTSCMCTSAALIYKDKKIGPFGMPGHGFVPKTNEIIAPNDEAEVEVVFDPNAHGPAGVGKISRVVYIESEGGGKLELVFEATVTP